jgi:hypothetical protein
MRLLTHSTHSVTLAKQSHTLLPGGAKLPQLTNTACRPPSIPDIKHYPLAVLQVRLSSAVAYLSGCCDAVNFHLTSHACCFPHTPSSWFPSQITLCSQWTKRITLSTGMHFLTSCNPSLHLAGPGSCGYVQQQGCRPRCVRRTVRDHEATLVGESCIVAILFFCSCPILWNILFVNPKLSWCAFGVKNIKGTFVCI